MLKLRVARHRLKALFFFSLWSDAVVFLLKRGLSKVSLPLTISQFGAMTQSKHRDAYITEPWQLHTYTNMQTHRVLAPWLLLPGLGPLIFLIAEEQWEGSQSNRPSDSYCLLPNNIAGSRTGRTNLSMSPQKSPDGRRRKKKSYVTDCLRWKWKTIREDMHASKKM